jgi:hypothetical protein
MDISKLTQGQKQALYNSLEYQKTPKTTAEKETLNQLRMELAEEVETEMGLIVLRVGDLVRMRDKDFDTYGEDYRNRWMKVRESGKGEFFNSHYLSSTGRAKRIYLL